MANNSLEDFEILGTIGTGSYGRVKHARRKEDNLEVAIKIVEKAQLSSENKKHQAMRERDYLRAAKTHPGIVDLYSTFQDNTNLYYVLEYCPKGDLAQLIERYGKNFPFELARQYSAELVSILEALRSYGIVHRDIKPSNLLISATNHLKLTDFGTAKEFTSINRGSFVGTADYVSPEMLEDGEVTYAADLWALGCIIYEMMAGKPPFSGLTQFVTFENVKKGTIEFPENMTPFAQYLIQALLLQDPTLRIGCQDIEVLKSDIFFQGIDFPSIFDQHVPDITSIMMSKSSHNPQIILSGIVKKKAGWIYKKRLLVISDQPRISYYEPSREEYKGDVSVSPSLKAEVKGRVEFHIITPYRTYFFKDLNGNPKVWVDAVNDMLANAYMPSP